MDHLDNEEIGTIWARHYSKRSENESSKSLLLTLHMIIKQRAESVVHYDAWDDKLSHVLVAARIPKEQFDTIGAESKSNLPE
jgi:hypothetical protein